MEGLFGREHTCAAIVEAGELEGILVGFGATVDQKELIIVVAADLAQPLGKLALEQVDDTVGVEAKLVELLGEHVDIMGMAVADADDSMSAVEVEILLTFVVPHMDALALDNVDIV